MTGQLIRHAICAAIFCSVVAAYAAAGTRDDGRVAIIDVSESLVAKNDGSPIEPTVFEHLRKSGVLVIGRYFSRCQQLNDDGTLWRKRLVDGDPDDADGEARTILKKGFAIMSIYQYNNRKAKFAGRFSGPDCIGTKYANEIKDASPQAREGILDAEAALIQAAAVKQPPGTAIYFGVDYDFSAADLNEKNGVLAYFREIKKQLHAADYRIGAYADGDALSLLMPDDPAKERLIDLAWLLPSASFQGNSDFHTKNHWHLFQSQTDNKILVLNDGTCAEVEYDVNIQNVAAAGEDLGFWDRNGAYKVPEPRTTEIFRERRFVCDRRGLSLPVLATSCRDPLKLRSCAVIPDVGEPCFARTVRLDPNQQGSGDLKIDFHDDGRFNGSIKQQRLTQSLAAKPSYEAAPRDPVLCPSSD